MVMEIVGGVASVAGVLSLAIQLVDSSLKLYKFLETIQGAPSEIVRLQEMVLQLHSILKGAQDVLEQQNKQEHVPPPDQSLYSALKSCQSKVKTLEDYITKIQRNAVQRGIQRVWGKVKIPFEQDHFAKINGQVQEACQIMNTALATNQTLLSLTHMSRTEIVISRVTGQQALKVQYHASSESVQSVVGTGIGRRFVREDVVEYKTILGVYRSRTVWTRPQIDMKNGEDHSTAPELLNYHTTVTFTPIVSQRFFTFTSQRAHGQVSRNMRVYITDPSKFDAIGKHFTSCGEMDQYNLATANFKQWLTEGGNPFLLDKYGNSLLHKALYYGYEDIACLLIQMRVGLDPCLRYPKSPLQLEYRGSDPRISRALCSELQSSRLASLDLGSDSVTIYIDSTGSPIGFSTSAESAGYSIYGFTRSRQTLTFILGEESEWYIASGILRDYGCFLRAKHDWSFSSPIKVAAFVYDTLLGSSIDQTDYQEIGRWLCTCYRTKFDSLLACETWCVLLAERGLTLESPKDEVMRIWNMQLNTRPLVPCKKGLAPDSTQDNLGLELRYNPQEACFELLREFEDIAIDSIHVNWSRFEDSWPYNSTGTKRFSRRHRKIMRWELAARQRERGLVVMLPGSFPIEHEDDDICGIHLQQGFCFLCKRGERMRRYRAWKIRDLHEDTAVDNEE